MQSLTWQEELMMHYPISKLHLVHSTITTFKSKFKAGLSSFKKNKRMEVSIPQLAPIRRSLSNCKQNVSTLCDWIFQSTPAQHTNTIDSGSLIGPSMSHLFPTFRNQDPVQSRCAVAWTATSGCYLPVSFEGRTKNSTVWR